MKLERKRKQLGGIPTASLSDVAFLLLVFFLTTTKFDIKKGLGIVLPPAADPSQTEIQKVKVKEENITRIFINDQGRIQLDEKDIAIQNIESTIRKIVTEKPEQVISLKSSRFSRYEVMVTVLDKLQAAGAEKISLSTN
jgi:biopolymer transport protein ExbD